MEKHEGVKVKGFYRLQLTENGEVVGDSGWHENQVTNDGFNDYLCQLLGGMAGSKQVSHLALGSGGEPAAGDNVLEGEVEKRQSVTAASSSSSKTIRFTGTFSSADSFVTNTQNLSNIGLFNTSSGGTIFAGNTYSSSSCATNQNVNVTYNFVVALVGNYYRKFRKLRETLFETIRSQISNLLERGSETIIGMSTFVDNGIVRTMWRRIELSGNDLALSLDK